MSRRAGPSRPRSCRPRFVRMRTYSHGLRHRRVGATLALVAEVPYTRTLTTPYRGLPTADGEATSASSVTPPDIRRRSPTPRNTAADGMSLERKLPLLISALVL